LVAGIAIDDVNIQLGLLKPSPRSTRNAPTHELVPQALRVRREHGSNNANQILQIHFDARNGFLSSSLTDPELEASSQLTKLLP
jgi:hypothetical protein